jgi:hypothetical protein
MLDEKAAKAHSEKYQRDLRNNQRITMFGGKASTTFKHNLFGGHLPSFVTGRSRNRTHAK